MTKLLKTYNFPLKVSTLIIDKVTQPGVKRAVTFTLVSSVELDFVNSYVASVASGLG